MQARWPTNQWYGAIGQQTLWFITLVTAVSGIAFAHGVENRITEGSKVDGRGIRYLETVGEFAQLTGRVPRRGLSEIALTDREQFHRYAHAHYC
jgi:hypothetical protein